MSNSYKKDDKRFIGLVLLAIAISCASLKGIRSGSEFTVEKPPYFESLVSVDLQGAQIGHLPIVLDKRADNPTSQQIGRILINQMNSFLNSQKWTTVLPAVELEIDQAPDLFFGNPAMFGGPVNASAYESDPDRIHPPMVLFYRNPSEKWKTKFGEITGARDVDYVLFLTVGLSEYFVRQTSLLGKKELALGTAYDVPVKWLTSLEDPVEVLQITGALLDKKGKMLRLGAEGIMATQSASVVESALGLQNVLSEAEIKKVATELRREDLPDHPLNYQAALQNLIAHLLQRNDLLLK